eukprot:CAMPEP_0171063546 /NCGR_PEP_ID=MMETSP0766_2-20121228/5729_1 /TAXON_ID=439317 /ORGANISM="Gambierdiscus australes, Strain CAWD 149" /LENGTH=233 /DNA_ID=CAMNT_0011519475 /DNA_START=137 /DNA_END=838 /DNA_ORIENTATION=+
MASVTSRAALLGAPVTTPERLVEVEERYGARELQIVKRHVLGKHEEGHRQFHVGGDRMGNQSGHHGFAPVYAAFINRLRAQGVEPLAVAEVGVLKGTGLAIWSEIFNQSMIYGFDIDLSNYESNLQALKWKGFNDSRVTVSTLDQTEVDSTLLEHLFGSQRLSMVVDDGCHTVPCANNTFLSFFPYLASRFLYFIEDTRHLDALLEEILHAHPELNVTRAVGEQGFIHVISHL